MDFVWILFQHRITVEEEGKRAEEVKEAEEAVGGGLGWLVPTIGAY